MFANAKERYAVIISAKSGDQLLSDTNLRYCKDTQKVLQLFKFNDNNIIIFTEDKNNLLLNCQNITPENVLTHLDKISKILQNNDELWVFLYGHSNVSRRGISIPTNGKRLRGNIIAEHLNKIEGKQFIFCFNTQSSAFMPLLSNKKNRIIVTATNDISQLNPPVFPKYFLDTWLKYPKNSLLKILQITAKETLNYFESNLIAVSEKSQVFDGEKIFTSPFESLDDNNKIAEIAFNDDKESLSPNLDNIILDVNEITKTETTLISTNKSDDIEILNATPQTLKLIKTANENLSKYIDFKSFYLFRNIDYVINKDFSTKSTIHTTIYINDESKVEELATLIFDDEPPKYEFEINNIKMIFPDGKWREPKTDITYGKDNKDRYHHIKFPGLRKGCIVELNFSYTTLPNFQIPEFHRNYILQKGSPVINTSITIKSPKKLSFKHKLYRIQATPIISETNYSNLFSYDFNEIPALEPLPYDPPLSETAIRMQISSLPSWKDFELWVRRILKGSDNINQKTAYFAKQLTINAKTDTEKVKAIYEFLCELRYETTPVNARALKPRLPEKVCFERYGDCKDKANALVALAKVVGVKGHLVLVNRMSVTDKDFPCWQFNHAIAYFPKLKGYPNGLWCDATDGSTPFSTLPPGDVGREGLVFYDKDAKFKTITLANNAKNLYAQNIRMIVNKDNSITGEITINATGLSDYYLRQTFKRLSSLQSKNYFQRIIDNSLFGINIENISISPLHNLDIPISIKSNFKGSHYLLTKKRLSLSDNFWKYVSFVERDRPLQINDGQPLLVSQIITVENDDTVNDFSWEKKSEYLDTKITITKNTNGWEQEIILDLKKSIIPVSEYSKLRKHILEFYAKMQ